jgi:hypothetical protein
MQSQGKEPNKQEDTNHTFNRLETDQKKKKKKDACGH